MIYHKIRTKMRALPLGIKNERRLKSLTGLTYEKYDILLDVFDAKYNEYLKENRVKKERKRKEGGGRKNALPTNELRLLFCLYYLKAYPTFDLLGDRFGMASSTANIHLHKLLPFLQQSLEELEVMPKRSFESPEALQKHVEKSGGVADLLIDATERPYFRYKDSVKRDAMFSGKKKHLPSRIQS